MQLTFSCSSSSNEIEPLKPEGEDTPLEKDEYTFIYDIKKGYISARFCSETRKYIAF